MLRLALVIAINFYNKPHLNTPLKLTNLFLENRYCKNTINFDYSLICILDLDSSKICPIKPDLSNTLYKIRFNPLISCKSYIILFELSPLGSQLRFHMPCKLSTCKAIFIDTPYYKNISIFNPFTYDYYPQGS
jgi:hypothetical protein